ncbi:MAG: hypothetical protein CBB97_09980 [Candidatus Endolissoclinum sp. TMED37]|nr:MAG: hypothetical protein CBB97_09980 [Candidatus Endolissoclinum sp. TMED37]|tara:strand:- start:335 stop:853 length:519 start_codon:yes stop_codon:yes gene_type:complete
MTKKLEETFNISDGEEEDKNTPTIEESQEITELLNTEIENTEKIDAALPMVTDLNEHDREMDDIHAKALKTFEDLLQLGMNVEVHAGAKILETANQLLKTAKEAKDSKVDRKLRMINLQLQKAKLDHQKDKDTSKTDEEITAEGSLNIDRNELLKRIASAQKVAEEVKEQNK